MGGGRGQTVCHGGTQGPQMSLMYRLWPVNTL